MLARKRDFIIVNIQPLHSIIGQKGNSKAILSGHVLSATPNGRPNAGTYRGN
jgi:hypothetical protein